jgi:hypothetical protein
MNWQETNASAAGARCVGYGAFTVERTQNGWTTDKDMGLWDEHIVSTLERS